MGDIQIDVSHDAYLARMAIAEAAALASRPSVLYRPSIFADGTAWCALLGPDLAVGVAGFGDTPAEAMDAFDKAFASQRTPAAILASRKAERDATTSGGDREPR